MQVTRFVLSAFVALAVVSYAVAEYSATDDVKILTEGNFDDTLKNNQFVLVEFYAPWYVSYRDFLLERREALLAVPEFCGANWIFVRSRIELGFSRSCPS
jgi:hypothetical protein